MKRLVIALLLAVSMTAMSQEEQINLGLIPTPQKVEFTYPKDKTARVDLSELYLKVEQVKSLPVEANMDQAYLIVIDKKNVTIRFVDSAGYNNARLTLNQLTTVFFDRQTEVPCVTITDWPAYKYRGWMDDQSRGPVPHAAYRQRQWETLHALKYNFCNYYTEHTLYQPEFPDLAPAYLAGCKPHPDEVINLQLFAHAEKTLRVPFYQYMMDSKANFNPSVEETYSFLKKRIAAGYRRIPNSPFFIINCDETEQLGTGRAKKLVDSLGADQVYVDFINRCYGMVKGQGNPRVAMWGDIVAKNPEMMRQLPKDMTYIMWAYEPLDSYDHLIKPFKKNGTPFWVAPSLSHSSNMIPNPYRYMKNIANLARDGYKNGAEGLMNTCWDDNGEALFDNCWHGLFWSAEMAWNPIKTDDPEEFARRERQFNENFERLFYGRGDTLLSQSQAVASSPNLGEQLDVGSNSSPKLGEGDRREAAVEGCVNQLYAVGALESNPYIADWYTSAALMEPLLNFNPDNTGETMAKRIGQVANLLRDIQIDAAANPHSQYAYDRILVTSTKAYLRSSIHRVLTDTTNNVMFSQLPKSLVKVYLDDLFALKREYLRLWDQENGDYERYVVMNRYDALAREVLDLDRHVFMQVGCDATSLHPQVTLRTLYNDRPIYYTLDGSEPDSTATRYTGPFPLERSATIRAISYNEYGEGVVSEQYLLSHLGMGAKITLNTQYSTYKSIYSGGGPEAIVDGQLGSNATYADGHWQGYWGDSIDAIIDLGKPTEIHEVSLRFMQNTFDWILAPTQIKVYTSADGTEWTLVADKRFDMDPRETGMRLRNYVVELNSQFSILNSHFIRVVVPNPGPLPSWHPAPGQPSYLFTDEIILH